MDTQQDKKLEIDLIELLREIKKRLPLYDEKHHIDCGEDQKENAPDNRRDFPKLPDPVQKQRSAVLDLRNCLAEEPAQHAVDIRRSRETQEKVSDIASPVLTEKVKEVRHQDCKIPVRNCEKRD